MNETKEHFICVMCDIVRNDPITLPCDCLSCKEHLRDHFVKNNEKTCPKCIQTFNVSNKDDFSAAHKSIKNFLESEDYLNENYKVFKREVQGIVDEW